MKSKIRPHNMTADFRSQLDREARAYFDTQVDEYAKRLQSCFVKRWIAATLLAANDQANYGAKRGNDLIEGIMQIINGNCDDVYEKKEIDMPGSDKAYSAMVDELYDRGICLSVTICGPNVRVDVRRRKKGEVGIR